MSHRTGAPLERGGDGSSEVPVARHPTLALGRSTKHALHTERLQQREAQDVFDIPTTRGNARTLTPKRLL